MAAETTPILHSVHTLGLVAILLGLPAVYVLTAYGYLARWHDRAWLLKTVIHENGRLTLGGSLLYFEHFVGCVPMVTVFALCVVGGVALTARVPVEIDSVRVTLAATYLLGAAALLILVASVASAFTVGRQRTIDYALQRIERDGVTSKGGSWNQLQLSNIPIALGTIGVGSALRTVDAAHAVAGDVRLLPGGVACIAAAIAVLVAMSMATRCTWASFRNPRWLAHSMREVATFPLTGIPIALASVVLLEYVLSGSSTWTVQLRWPSLILLASAVVIVGGELALIRNIDVLAIAQKPSFAAEGLSIPYLLAAHVFEHALDFALIALLAGGLYALLRSLALA